MDQLLKTLEKLCENYISPDVDKNKLFQLTKERVGSYNLDFSDEGDEYYEVVSNLSLDLQFLWIPEIVNMLWEGETENDISINFHDVVMSYVKI